MKVDLVWVTPDAEKMIAHIARVSNPSNQDNPNYARLIKYLIQNKHFSPFEMSNMCVRIETSRAIAQQILRHRSFSFQEFSQRYSEATEFEPIELRQQAEKNRQSSTLVIDPKVKDVNSLFFEYDDDQNMVPLADDASSVIATTMQKVKELYAALINAGVSKETARFILPLATQTTLYMNGSCRSWIHYLALRNDEHTQKEHQKIAEQIEALFAVHFPNTYEAIQLIKKEESDKAFLYRLFLEGNLY